MPNERLKAGEADPETRRKKLREILDAEAGGDSTKKVRPKPTMRDAVDEGVRVGSEKRLPAKKPPKRAKERRFGPKGQTEDELTGQ
jgi:hypothetical protein